MNEKIGIIGFGNMGSAIAERIKKYYQVTVYDKDKNKAAKAAGIKFALNLKEIVEKCEVLILAVKPQDIDPALKDIRNNSAKGLIISIAAGISTQHIERIVNNARVIRVMPNLGAKIGESVTCICKGAFTFEDDLGFANELFSYLGTTEKIEERLMNAATAISGSGPAYIFYFIDENSIDAKHIPDHARHEIMMRLERAAESVGFDHETAATLAANTTNSSILLLSKTNMKPKELIEQVASKGGTTEAALKVIKSGGSWDEAALAALKRAEELARR